MEEYRTYIFRKSKKKSRKRFIYNSLIIAAIGGVLYMFLIGILGLGLGIVGAISLIIGLIQMKIYDDKYMGITAYGHRKEKLIINEEYLMIDDAKIPYAELKDLIIYVDEYAGKSREIFGVHHGGNNEIKFTHKDTKFSFNYIIKNKSDFRNVEDLVDRIEKRQKLKMSSYVYA